FGSAVTSQHVAAHKVEVDLVEQPHGPIAAAQGDDGVRVRVAPGVDEVGPPLFVGAGQIRHSRVASADVLTRYDGEAPGFELRDGPYQRFLVARSRRRDEADGVPGLQRRGLEVRARGQRAGRHRGARDAAVRAAADTSHFSPGTDFPVGEPRRAVPAYR